MGDYNRNRSDAGRGAGRDFGRRNAPSFSRGDRDSRPPVRMHSAVCSECGNECEVPFKPTGDKPVFCNNCFRKDGANGGREDRDRDSDRKRAPMHKAVCDECGNGCEVPFRPSGDKPVYCSDCFGKGSKGGGGKDNSQQLMQQFEALNNKVDRILSFLIPAIVVPKGAKKEKEVKEVVVPVEVVEEATEKKTKKAKKPSKKASA